MSLANSISRSFPESRQWYQKLKQAVYPIFSKDFAAAYGDRPHPGLQGTMTLNKALYFSVMKMGLQDELRYSDRNSMAHSREVRLPYLSHELVSFLFSLPATLKIRQGFTKWILRKAAESALPPEITWRRSKIGYEPPSGQWMHAPAVDALVRAHTRRLQQTGILSKSLQKGGVAAPYDHLYNLRWRILSLATIL